MCSESERPTSGNTLTPCDVGALSALAVQFLLLRSSFATCSPAPLADQNRALGSHVLDVCALMEHFTFGVAFAFFAFAFGAFGAFGAGASTGVLGAPCASAMSVSMRASSAVMRLVRVGVVMAFLLCVRMCGLVGKSPSSHKNHMFCQPHMSNEIRSQPDTRRDAFCAQNCAGKIPRV